MQAIRCAGCVARTALRRSRAFMVPSLPVRALASKTDATGSVEAEIAELEAQMERSEKSQSSLERRQRQPRSAGAQKTVSPFEDISDLDEDLTATPKLTSTRKVTNRNAWKQPRFGALSAAAAADGVKIAGMQEREDGVDADAVESLENDTDRINASTSELSQSVDDYANASIDEDIRAAILKEVDDEMRTVAETLSLEDLKAATSHTSAEFLSFTADLERRARPFTSESSHVALGGNEEDELVDDAVPGSKLPAQGLPVDYCVFCYHGTHFLRHDNVALLTKFVSDKGLILPKRFTKCCPKHQRRLARTVKRARWMNMAPWHSKIHPRLRFTSMTPDPTLEGHVLGRVAFAGSVADRATGGDRSAAIGAANRASVDAALTELDKLAGSR